MSKITSLIFILFYLFVVELYSQTGTIDFNTTDDSNLGSTADDGEGGSTDIPGVTFNIFIGNGSGAPSGGSIFFDNSGGGYEGLSSSTAPGSTGFLEMILKTNDGSEFDFNGFSASEYGFIGALLKIEGFRNGISQGSTTVNLTVFVSSVAFNSFSDAIFGNVDEIRISENSGASIFGAFDAFVINPAIIPNTPPSISLNDATIAFRERDGAISLDASGTVNDPDGDADWNGGSLQAQITANSEATDELLIADIDGDGTAITISGTDILANGTNIGNLNVNGGTVTNNTALVITFDSDATNTIVQEVLQSIRYQANTTTPSTLNRTITVTATDSNAASVNDTKTISITSVPDVTSVTVPTNGTYIQNQDLNFTLNFDQNVIVNTTMGTPRIELTIGSQTRYANYTSGTNTSALLFSYTIQNNDEDLNGISIEAIEANGGTIQNSGSENALLLVTNAGSTASILVDGIAPTGYSVTIDQSPINAANDDAVSFTFASAEVGTTYNYAFTSSGAPGSVTGSGTIATATDQITGIDISGLADGMITLSVTLTDVNGNNGAAATDTETKETVAPTGYSVTIDQSPINAANDDAVNFTFANAEVGTTYNYAFTSSGAPGSVTGSGTIATATDQITGIDISGLADGMITLSVTLTDVNGNTGAEATDTETKETVAPTGYSVTIDQSPINAVNDDAVSFTFASAEVGTTYNYAFTSSGAPGSVTGSGTIATATDQITGIDISGLADGMITLSVTLTDVNGNNGAAATDTETKETVAPTGYSVTIDQSPINAANDDAVSFTFTSAEVGTTYNYAFTSSGAPGSVTGSGTIATATDQITGIDISGLADGMITLSVTLTDVNGNTGAAATDTETKDASIPLDPTVNVPSTAITVTTTTQTISGSYIENGITIHAYADSDNDGTADNTTSLGSATVTGNTWNFTVNLTTDFVNNFVVQAEDATGNSSNYVDVPTITQTNTITWTGTMSSSWNTAGNWSPNTVPTSTTDVIIPNTASIPNFPTISSAVNVNSITIASGASLIANASVNANVTYNRNLPTTNWYLVAAPVKGEKTEDIIANHSFATGTGANIGIGAFENNGTIPWFYATNSTIGDIISGTGVAMKLAAAGDVSITGNLNVINVPTSVEMGDRNNFNLIGNPFTSYINSAVLAGSNSVINNATFWLWDGSQYITYNNMTPLEIAPAQGFFIEANANTDVNFSTANQNHRTTDTFMRQTPIPSFELFIASETNKTGTKVFYADGKTKGADYGFDSKMFGGVSYNFGVYTELLENNEGEKLAIQTLPNSNYENMIIPVGVIADADKEITFSVSSENLPTGIEIYLEDKVENTIINLTEGNHKVILKTASKDTGRFYIHTTAKRLSNEEVINNFKTVSLYKSAPQELTISGLQGKATVKVFSIVGKEVNNTIINSKGNTKIDLPELPTGVYVVRLSSDSGKLTKKIIVE